MQLAVKRKEEKFVHDHTRVITRLHLPDCMDRISKIIKRVMDMPDEQASNVLDRVLSDFSGRHRNIPNVFESNFCEVSSFLPENAEINRKKKFLIGAYFTMEYSIESAALFNPSIVPHPDQTGLEEGKIRFIMSFRATGEGHISSIEFRSGIIDKKNSIYLDPISDFVETAKIQLNPIYNKHLFLLKLNEMDACNEVTAYLLEKLPDNFTFNELKEKITRMEEQPVFFKQLQSSTIEIVLWLARSNYELKFSQEYGISERVIFPVSENESSGIEDARFVRFVDDDGEVTYYATYTAYNGFQILPQMIETKDFITFKIITLNGKAVQNKGMALFPRKIKGKYVMLSRQDGENNHIMFSDDIHFWQKSSVIQEPSRPWEFVQIGNCGSPIETEEGWILLTHGVGPMRQYSLGVVLLDLEDPKKKIGLLPDPLLSPNENEREGYVPNVVYTCGALIHNEELIIPYAMSDVKSGIASVSVRELLDNIKRI